MESTPAAPAATAANELPKEPRWKPLNSRQRRVLGVLVEKAKTTPDQYPLSLNSLTSGCNQKNNRDPVMNLEQHAVEDVIESLRQMGAVAEVHSGGRVARYRHYLKDWLGVDGAEVGVMAELLLRGAQTVGELRGRAARMSPIAGLHELMPVLQSLREKNLIVELTPSGRGQIVTHNLYSPDELQKLKSIHGNYQSPAGSRFEYAGDAGDIIENDAIAARPTTSPAQAVRQAAAPPPAIPPDVISELRVEQAELRAEVMRLRREVAELREALGVEPTQSTP